MALSSLLGSPNVPYAEIWKQFVTGGAMLAMVVGLQSLASRVHYITVLVVFLGALTYVGVLLVISRRIREKAPD